ncbi:protein of unknown function [Clostridium beijerinckii]|nr:protein of unknown function [Clostridium beijerinckii]
MKICKTLYIIYMAKYISIKMLKVLLIVCYTKKVYNVLIWTKYI